ncbi:hypothetical protein [Granulicella paludicola]|uniref:hypothetical protein n=1 Tax=Granulicella paludicola TaxID=474951 RepID=UPI0021E0B808|nr:hypothetical protein [Granulicella paludicola]
MNAIAAVGATLYLAFKRNTAAKSNKGVWGRMFHLYSYNRDEYLTHYHKRSNVESTFMSVKAKFGEGVRSKTFVAQRNEVLCKFLCHNICCVIQSMHEFGIDAKFGKLA